MFDTVDSTNTILKQEASLGAKDGTVVIANYQTNGRGRLGRSFYSPDRTGLYMSLLIRRVLSFEQALMLTTTAAVAVMNVLKLYADNVKIKWVNDIYVNDKKVCGILTESSFSSDGSLDYAIIGIGINVFAPLNGFPDEIKDKAGYLFDSFSDGLLEKIVAEILIQIDSLIGQNQKVVELYRANSWLDNKRVLVTGNGYDFYATVNGVNEKLQLIVTKDDNSKMNLFSGDVSVAPIGGSYESS